MKSLQETGTLLQLRVARTLYNLSVKPLVVATDKLLTEDGDFLLHEDGSKILIEY